MIGRITSRPDYDRRWPVVQLAIVNRTETEEGERCDYSEVIVRYWWPWERCIAIGHNPGA